jgi:hypothetical protein
MDISKCSLGKAQIVVGTHRKRFLVGLRDGLNAVKQISIEEWPLL